MNPMAQPAPVFLWIQATPVAALLRNSNALISIVETIHLLGLAMLAGTILMVDLSLLGLGMRGHPVSRIAGELAPWTKAGLAVLALSGALLFASSAVKCSLSPSFSIKMGLLLLAVVSHFTLHGKVAAAEPPASPWRARSAACLSLGLWIGVALTAKIFSE